MSRFFSEIEFKANSGNKYWFPLFQNAKTQADAENSLQAVITAINENYEVVRFSVPKLYVTGHPYSVYTDDYVRQNLRGRLAVMQFNVWQFQELEAQNELSFNEHFELVVTNAPLEEASVASTVERHQFIVRQFNGASPDLKDVLIVNVVKPD